MSISSRLSLPVPLLLFIVTSVSGDPPARTDCYGDPLPPGAITRFGTLRLRPAETCVLLAFAPDGKTLVSADRSNGVLIWDRATGKRLRQFGVFPGNLRCAAASPDGRLVAMAGDSTSPGWGNLYCVWDIATGKEIRHLREQQQQATIGSVISAIAFSPDGATLASRHSPWPSPRTASSSSPLASTRTPAPGTSRPVRQFLTANPSRKLTTIWLTLTFRISH